MKRPTRHLAIAISLGVLAPLVSTAAPAHAAGITYISFEDVPQTCFFSSTTPLRDRYAAAKFRGHSATDGGAVLDNCSGFGVAPRTGSRFLAFNDDVVMSNGGTPVGPQKINFPDRQKSVSIWVSQGGFSVGAASFSLKGKRDGRVVQTASTSTSASGWVELRVKSRKGLDGVVLAAPQEPDGTWVADDLTMAN